MARDDLHQGAQHVDRLEPSIVGGADPLATGDADVIDPHQRQMAPDGGVAAEEGEAGESGADLPLVLADAAEGVEQLLIVIG